MAGKAGSGTSSSTRAFDGLIIWAALFVVARAMFKSVGRRGEAPGAAPPKRPLDPPVVAMPHRSRPRLRPVAAAALIVALGAAGLVGVAPAGTSPAGAATVDATYAAQGPGPITGGQTENVTPNNEVVGAVHTVVAHPGDPDILWVGTTNGGVWRTNNATAASPSWRPLTDQMPGLSIGALELDPTVATNTVLVAGIGRYASFFGVGEPTPIGGPLAGVLRSTNGGGTWTNLSNGITGENISGVAARGNTIVVSSGGNTQLGAPGLGGIFRSTDGGANFARLSGNGTSGLPNRGVFDLVGDPSNNARLYAGAQDGIYRSDDTGATWSLVTNQITGINTASTNNIEMAVHNSTGNNIVFAGVINNGQLNGLWRSVDQGANWTQLDTPSTNEGGATIGIQPRSKPGGQGGIHFSIVADPTDPNLVYVGGDRQPIGAGNSWPNSIGASNFSGRLFRCDASLGAGAQCTPLTHNGTSNNSSPHADSREMVFDANGDIIETDDGGIYRQTDPATTNGVWQSLNGNLANTEPHSCDYDSVADIIICGSQDTGSAEQSATGSSTWTQLSQGDGGFVAVNDAGATSVRFSSSNRISTNSFRRRTCTAANACVNAAPGFNVVGQGTTIQALEGNGLPIYTPMVMNRIDGTRLIVASSTRVYESTDSLDNLNIIATPGVNTTRAIAYGGRQGGADNAGVLWYGDASNRIWLRTGAAGAPAQVAGWTNANGLPYKLVMDPEDWATAYVTNRGQVFRTTDAGLTFTDITGTLTTHAPAAQIVSLEVLPIAGSSEYALLAGTDQGAFVTQTQNLGVWAEFGNNLPNTLVSELKYDANDDVLLVATMGRSTWLLANASSALPVADIRVTKTDSPDPVKAGEELFYTVTTTNDGPDKAVAVVVVDDLPDEVIYLENNGGCAYDPVEHRLTCEVGDIRSGGARSFTIKTLVRSDAVVNESDGTLLIKNHVSAGSVSIDSDTSNNSFITPTFVQDKSDLKVTKMCKPDGKLRAGETGTCTMYVDNLGPSSSRDVVLRDTHISDGQFTFGAITTSQGTCSRTDNVITCQLGALPAASPTSPGRATVTVDLSSNEAVDINDVAEVTAATPDPDTTNNQARGSLHVMAVSDLALTKVGPAAAIAGTDITYDLSVTNNGPSTAEGVVIDDVLSTGVRILSVAAPAGGTCNAGTPGNAALPTRCSFGTLSPGATRTMVVVARVLPDTRGMIHNDARASSPTFDDDLSNNLATVATDVTGDADLSITKTDSPDPVVAGNQLTYTITVTNGGPSSADSVRVTDTIPAGTTYSSGVDGNGVTVCALVQTATVVCDLATMQPGTSKTVFLTVKVAPSVPHGAVLTNNAGVSAATPDSDQSDNSATATTGVIASAELWLDKTGVMQSGNPSPVVVFTLDVHNRAGCESDAQSTPTPTCGEGGPSDAQNVVVTDRLPLDPKKVVVQYVSPQCQYTKETHTVTCSSATVPAGAKVSYVIEVQVAGSVGTVTNAASVTSTTTDPVSANNTDDVTIVIKGGTGKK